MRAVRARPAFVLAALGASVATACLVTAELADGDPMMVLEVLGAVALGAWAFVGAGNVLRGRRLARALDAHGVTSVVAGVECRILRGGRRAAFVLGTFRPAIYIGEELVAALDPEELRAVLFHEDHHRRTLAPLRSAALEAWLTLAGRWTPVRALLVGRLAHLEEEADAEALRRGVSPATLASALVKSDVSLMGAGAAFSAASDSRLRNLLDAGAGQAAARAPRLPYEWLPLAAVVIVTVACHIGGLPPFA